MDLDSQQIGALAECCRRNWKVKISAFVRAVDRDQRPVGVGHESVRHVAAENFRAVEKNDGTVVAQETENSVGDGGRVSDPKPAAEIGRYKSGASRTTV